MLPRFHLLCFVMLFIMSANTLFAQNKKPVKSKTKVTVDTAAAKRDSTWKAAIKDKKKVDGLFTLYQDTVSGTQKPITGSTLYAAIPTFITIRPMQ